MVHRWASGWNDGAGESFGEENTTDCIEQNFCLCVCYVNSYKFEPIWIFSAFLLYCRFYPDYKWSA